MNSLFLKEMPTPGDGLTTDIGKITETMKTIQTLGVDDWLLTEIDSTVKTNKLPAP